MSLRGALHPGERAAKAIAENPELSDRAIAEKIGSNAMTVGRARKKSTVTDVAVRVGKDGKRRKMPKKKPCEPIEPIEEFWASLDVQQRWQRVVKNLATNAIAFCMLGAHEKFPITDELMTLADNAAQAWQAIANDLRQRKVADGR